MRTFISIIALCFIIACSKDDGFTSNNGTGSNNNSNNNSNTTGTYTCTCTSSYDGETFSESVTISGLTYSEAVSACNAGDMSSGGITVNCSLN